MQAVIPSAKKGFSVEFNVQSARPQRVRIVAWDLKSPATKYYDRCVNMTYEPRYFMLSFPQSPNVMGIRINGVDSDAMGESDSSLKVTNVKYKYLLSRSCGLDSEEQACFVFVRTFSEKAGQVPAGIYRKGKFTIIYREQLTANKNGTGQPVNTPARIGHDTGIMEISRAKFLTYSVPMRLIILLHEGGHKYFNPKIGAKIENEIGADLNALYIYLCAGYPRIDARLAFAYVFAGADHALNRRRMAIIEDFITKFEKGQVK